MGGGIVLSYLGKDISGLEALISTLAGLFYVYIYSQKKIEKQKEQSSDHNKTLTTQNNLQ